MNLYTFFNISNSEREVESRRYEHVTLLKYYLYDNNLWRVDKNTQIN